MSRVLITGGAGFIGSTLADRLLAVGHDVVIFDNFSTGHDAFVASARAHTRCTVVRGDILDTDALSAAVDGVDAVFHLAANADVRHGTEHPRRDLEQNTIGTFNVLEAMRRSTARTIVFSSTGSVYGEPTEFPTPETAAFPVQTSLYGTSKLAAEGLIAAYTEGFGFQGIVCRFVSILGERYTHGHVFDFVRALLRDPSHLRILGDGQQRKSYLYVQDCVDAMLAVWNRSGGKPFEVYNLGTDEYCQVDSSAGWICDAMGVAPTIEHTGGQRGWIGDSPFIFLDCRKLRGLGWQPSLSIRQGVEATVRYLLQNRQLLEARG